MGRVSWKCRYVKGANVTATSASSAARGEPAGSGSVDQEKPPYLWAGLTAIVVLAIYLATLAPTTPAPMTTTSTVSAMCRHRNLMITRRLQHREPAV